MVKYIKGKHLFYIGQAVGKRDSTIQKGIRIKRLARLKLIEFRLS